MPIVGNKFLTIVWAILMPLLKITCNAHCISYDNSFNNEYCLVIRACQVFS